MNNEIGRVKHVGKTGSKKKNTCWIEKDGKVEELDFLKDVSGWTYQEEGKRVRFNNIDENSSDDQRKNDSKRMGKDMEAEGIFYLTRSHQSKKFLLWWYFQANIKIQKLKEPCRMN